jgi:peptidoglycan/xylan/chitin deacetylase (PgdA/CDA1 family)
VAAAVPGTAAGRERMGTPVSRRGSMMTRLAGRASVLMYHGVGRMLGGANLWDPPPRRDLMTADDVLELAVEGHEIGSHGVSHVRLAGLAPDRLDREVRNSRNQIARVVGSEPSSFCYPCGSVDDKAVRVVGRAGYSYACAVVRVPGLPTQLAMPRVGLDERDRGPRLVAKLFLRGR